MLEILQTLIIGAIQGVTEFLPVSSSAHLVLTPYIFGWGYKGLDFDVALHFGTVIAIVCYFWKDWMIIIKSAVGSRQSAEDDLANSKQQTANYPKNLLWQIIIATIPAGIAGFLINDYVESNLHSPILLASNLVIFGIILYLVDRLVKKSNKLETIGFKQSFFVGLAQSLALIPGISRSGITMIASRSLGLKRESAARFSFLLGTPAMIGAFLFELKDLTLSDVRMPFILGIISSTIFGFLAIKYLLEYLKRGSFSVFMWYRIALAIIVVGIYLAR